MKIKVKLLDKTLLNNYYNILSVVSVIASFLFLFCDIPDFARLPAGIALVLLFVSLYLLLWLRANRKKKIILHINHSTVEICGGDLFSCDGYKVIAFNEYFDTQADDVVISTRSLNGKYLLNYVTDLQDLDARIAADPHLRQCIAGTEDRPAGKNTKYTLGTVFKNGDYFLMAFSKFDSSNRAYLEIKDYIHCLIHFWEECDIHSAGHPISMALPGTGITRFRGYENVSEQELLELLIWTFQTSKVQLNLKIVLTEALLEKVNLCQLKERFRN